MFEEILLDLKAVYEKYHNSSVIEERIVCIVLATVIGALYGGDLEEIEQLCLEFANRQILRIKGEIKFLDETEILIDKYFEEGPRNSVD